MSKKLSQKAGPTREQGSRDPALWGLDLSGSFYQFLGPIQGFPGGTVVKNLPGNSGDAGNLGSIPGSRRSPGGGNGNPLQYFCLENPRKEASGRLQSIGSQKVRYDWATELTVGANSVPTASNEENTGPNISNLHSICSPSTSVPITGMGSFHHGQSPTPTSPPHTPVPLSASFLVLSDGVSGTVLAMGNKEQGP